MPKTVSGYAHVEGELWDSNWYFSTAPEPYFSLQKEPFDVFFTSFCKKVDFPVT